MTKPSALRWNEVHRQTQISDVIAHDRSTFFEIRYRRAARHVAGESEAELAVTQAKLQAISAS